MDSEKISHRVSVVASTDTRIKRIPDNPGSINIPNDSEEYEKFFRLGGSTRQMTMQTLRNYSKYKTEKIREMREYNSKNDYIVVPIKNYGKLFTS